MERIMYEGYTESRLTVSKISAELTYKSRAIVYKTEPNRTR